MLKTAHRSRPARGETANGDRVIVCESEGSTLLGVVDALGHGPLAEAAALTTLEALSELGAVSRIEDVFQHLHRALRGSRGAAITLLRIVDDELETAGVGNVGCRAHECRVPIIWTPGVLGHNLRRLRVTRVTRPTQGRVALHSDGISSRFPGELLTGSEADEACEAIMAKHSVSHDDATVLIVDW